MLTVAILIVLAVIVVNAVKGYKGVDTKATHVCVNCGSQTMNASASRPKWSWMVFPFNLLIAPKRCCPMCDGDLIPIHTPRGKQLAK